MDLSIGIRDMAREIDIDVPEELATEVVNKFESAFRGECATVDLTDSRGTRYLICANTVTYLKINTKSQRRVGFGL